MTPMNTPIPSPTTGMDSSSASLPGKLRLDGHPPTDPGGSVRGSLEPRRFKAMTEVATDIPAEAFRKATLESERIRILCLLSIMAAVLMLITTRALTTGIPEQRALL